MILVLPSDAAAALVDQVVSQTEQLGWECAVSRGDEQVIVALTGSGEVAALEAALARITELDVIPVLAAGEYARLRARRRMLTGLASGLGVLTAIGAGIPVAGFLLPPKGALSDRSLVRVAAAGELSEWTGKRLVLLGKPVVLVRLDGERYFALSAICTHMSVCQLDWDPERRQLLCPCHGGAFDVYGNVVRGPPSIPLPTWPVERLGGELFLRREA